MFTATITHNCLTDGSMVYGVALEDGGDPVAEFDAVSEDDALKFAVAVLSAMRKHILLETDPQVKYRW